MAAIQYCHSIALTIYIDYNQGDCRDNSVGHMLGTTYYHQPPLNYTTIVGTLCGGFVPVS